MSEQNWAVDKARAVAQIAENDVQIATLKEQNKQLAKLVKTLDGLIGEPEEVKVKGL